MPGKFEGEPVWVEEFYDEWNEGLASDEVENVAYFVLTDQDKEEFPELEKFYGVRLHEDDNGFVYGQTFETEMDYDEDLGATIDDAESEDT